MNNTDLIPYNPFSNINSYNNTYPLDSKPPLPQNIIDAIEEKNKNNFLNNLRIQRNQILNDTDWTQLSDAPLSDIVKQQYAIYRQALRDLPSNSTYPDIFWPIEPSIK